VYIMAMISIVKLGFEGKMKITILEWIMYFVASAFLVFFFVMYYEELIRVNILNGDTTQKVRAFISIGFTLMCLIFFFIWYGVYYHVKQKMRSTQYQTKLDNNFKLDDDWFVVENFTNNKFTRINKIYANPRMSTSWKKKILNRLFNKTNLEIQSFQRRNLKIYANKHNANLLKSQILFKRLSTLKQQTISKI
jgi:hypothetical protein